MYSKNDFYLNPNLRNNYDLLMNCFLEDASFVVFFSVDDITKSIENSAVSRGFSVSYADLVMNPDLRNVSFIMRQAINDDPSFIRYVGRRCYLDSSFVLDTLKKYEISVNDLFFNPDLCFNIFVMKFLPQYKVYRGYLDFDEKVDYIVSTLKSGGSINNLPFLFKKFGSMVDSSVLEDLYDALRIDESESSIDFQEDCFYKLDKFIDALVSNKYSSSSFRFSSIVDLNNCILSSFERSISLKNYSPLVDIIHDISSFIDGSLEYVQKNIFDFYTIFLCTGTLTLSDTSSFCNNVLNMHRNSFLSHYKFIYSKDLYSKFNLSSKKRNLIINSRKLRLISNYIRSSRFDLLGVSSIDSIIDECCSDIINNKLVMKSGVSLSNLDSLCLLFRKKGFLEFDDVIDVLGCFNDKVNKFVFRKFESIRFKFIDSVELDDYEISLHDRSLVGFNYNNFNIYDRDKYFSNISNVLISVNENDALNILRNRNLISSVKWLILFIDLFPDFDVSDFIGVMSSFDVVNDKIKSISFGDILDNLDDLFSLSRSYGSSILEDSVLGDEFVSTIGSVSSSKYVDYYLKMLGRKSSFIPPIRFSYDGFSFESGVFGDIDRLLIGFKVRGSSCIHVGSKTFDEVLLGDNGDVILVRDSDNNFVSRIFVFRCGNVIQLVSNMNNKFPIDVFCEISRQIIDKSLSDNIDFICVNSLSCEEKRDFDIMCDNRFIFRFPHADLYDKVIVLFSRGNIDFDCVPKCSYSKVRSHINYGSSDTFITRLRALDVLLESDSVVREEKRLHFVPFFSKEYQCAFNGEDWYLAVRFDGSIEELVLPIASSEAYDEINSVRRKLIDRGIQFK